MHKTVVINAVGLTPALLGPSMPHLSAFAKRGALATIKSVLPAVTCSVQATFLTGCYPGEHGIVGNGWYCRDECEVKFWKQSNALIQRPKIWEKARALDPTFTCANLFWWFNMYSTADYSVTPRPMYPADGRKIADIYTRPANLRFALQRELGQFPLFKFWGPGASIEASRWIARAAKMVEQYYSPTLTLLYLPHLDYCLQRFGPIEEYVTDELCELDTLCGDLIEYYTARGVRVIFISEYGIAPVSRAVHLNRELRKRGLLAVRHELGRELLDAGASVAFVVADHQIAHVYVNDRRRLQEVSMLLQEIDGVAHVLDDEGKRVAHLDHARAGDLVAIAETDAWFTYYYWLDDAQAPDYARTVDIHRKPGYDPVELFFDPRLKIPQIKVGRELLKRWLGLRSLMEVVPLDASLVRGSHGRIDATPGYSPVFITQAPDLLDAPIIEAAHVYELVLRHLSHPGP